MRRQSLEHLITTAKIEGKRVRGRQGEKLDGIARSTGQSKTTDVIMHMEDREVWHRMISNAKELEEEYNLSNITKFRVDLIS